MKNKLFLITFAFISLVATHNSHAMLRQLQSSRLITRLKETSVGTKLALAGTAAALIGGGIVLYKKMTTPITTLSSEQMQLLTGNGITANPDYMIAKYRGNNPTMSESEINLLMLIRRFPNIVSFELNKQGVVEGSVIHGIDHHGFRFAFNPLCNDSDKQQVSMTFDVNAKTIVSMPSGFSPDELRNNPIKKSVNVTGYGTVTATLSYKKSSPEIHIHLDRKK